MTFEDEIKQYFEKWSIGDIDIEDIKSGKYKNAEDFMEKIFLKDCKKALQSFFIYDMIINGLKKLPKTVGELDS